MLFRIFSSSFLLIIALLGLTSISVASPLAMVVNLDQRHNPIRGDHTLRVARMSKNQKTWLKRKQKEPATFFFALCIGTKNCYIYDSSLNTVTTIETPKYTSPNGSMTFDHWSAMVLGLAQFGLSRLSKVIDSLVNKVDIKDDIAWIEESIKVMGDAGAIPDVDAVLNKWTTVQQEFADLIAVRAEEEKRNRVVEDIIEKGKDKPFGHLGKLLNKPS